MAGASTPSETTFISVLAFHTPFRYDKCHITLVNKSIYIFLSFRIMEYTVYRAGMLESRYDRGGVWYDFTRKGAEYYKYLYKKNGKLTYIHEKEIEVFNPFFVEIGNVPENYYPYLAYYVVFIHNMQQADPYHYYSLTHIAEGEVKHKFFEEKNGYVLQDKEELFVYTEKKLSDRLKELGYDSIIFTSDGQFAQVFKFN